MIVKSIFIIFGLLVACSADCPSKCRCLGPWAKCSKGNLDDISGEFPPEVTTLTLIDFDLQTLEAGALAKLSVASNLWKLELYKGNLKTIKENAFTGLGTLESLYITGNNVETVEPGAFGGLSHLTVLDLTENALQSLPSNAFEGLDNVQKIYLNRNKQLRSLDLGVFENISSLQLVSAKECNVEAVQPMRSRKTSSVILDLRQNPLKCDCSLKNAVSGVQNVSGDCSGRDVKVALKGMQC